MPTENLNKKEKYIQFLFNQVAERYDLFNRIASLSLDSRWRKKAIVHLQPENGDRFLDIGTGTGELALKLAKRINGGEVVGIDFCDKMLDIARRKKEEKSCKKNIRFILAKAEDLPFPDNYFDGIITGFVMRHLKMEEALKEIIRVLRPNGHLVILEIGKPESIWFRKLYYFYLRRILPLIGMTLVGTKEPFCVLASSVIGFLEAEELKSVLQKMGLRKIRNFVLNKGIVSLYVGVK
ncbi:MAG: ubiquinone/menaquinone biosynthesis methyltransferase [bacterium]